MDYLLLLAIGYFIYYFSQDKKEMEDNINIKKSDTLSISDIKCRDGNPVPELYMENAIELINNFSVIFNEIKNYTIISGFRTPEYNKKKDGALLSQHLTAKAIDFSSTNYSPPELFLIVKNLMDNNKIKKGGIAIYKNFLHYDIRGYYTTWET